MRKFLAAAVPLMIALAACGGGSSATEKTDGSRNAVLPLVRLSGRVVDAKTLKPLGGLKVTGYSYLTQVRTNAETDAMGKFSMSVSGDEFGLQIAPTSTYCGGMVKILATPQASLNAIATSRDNANTFVAGDKGTIGVYKLGAPLCP